MKRTFIAALLVWLTPLLAQGQDLEFPHSLKPGKSFKGSAEVDTLFWVLKSRQYDRCIENSLALEKSEEMIGLLETKSMNLEEVISRKDSTIADLQGGYNRYKNLWEQCDVELEKSEIKVLKLRRATFLTGIVGIAAGILVGALVL